MAYTYRQIPGLYCSKIQNYSYFCSMKRAITPITSIKNVKSVKSGLLESVLKLRSTILYFFKAKVLITNQEHLLHRKVEYSKQLCYAEFHLCATHLVLVLPHGNHFVVGSFSSSEE